MEKKMKCRKISDKMLQTIIKLPAPDRYSHFIKEVAGWQYIWGLYDDGWATSETDEGEKLIPFWPARDYAEIYAKGDWDGCKAKAIEIHDFLDSFLPYILECGLAPGVFFVEDDGAVDIKPNILVRDLKTELSRME